MGVRIIGGRGSLVDGLYANVLFGEEPHKLQAIQEQTHLTRVAGRDYPSKLVFIEICRKLDGPLARSSGDLVSTREVNLTFFAGIIKIE